jgi:glycosyltransferase involved in cell wall biosynthesis
VRIVHVNEHLSYDGGIETYLLALLPLLDGLGHVSNVLYSKGDPRLARRALAVPGLGAVGRRAESECHALFQAYLNREKPHVVHIHNVHNIGALRACLDHCPVVLHGHDYRYVCPASSFYFRRTEETCQRTCGLGCFAKTLRGQCLSLRPHYGWNYYRRVRFVADNAKRFARVVANSEYTRSRFVAAGFEASQIKALPYFCPIETAAAARPRPERTTVLFVGRIRPYKGYRYFVEALGQLPDHVGGVMVGDFSSKTTAEVTAAAARAGCHDRLELRDWAPRARMSEILSEASVVVFPSIWPEPMGIVGLEALARGIPVVACDVGGVREWLVDGKNGHLVPPRNAPAIAGAVLKILESPDRGEALGRFGLELVQERFSPSRHVEELLAVYETAGRSSRGVSLQPKRGERGDAVAVGAACEHTN